MKTLNEKEKKLSDAIEKLNNLEFQSHNLADEIVTLDHQKNQSSVSHQQIAQLKPELPL